MVSVLSVAAMDASGQRLVRNTLMLVLGDLVVCRPRRGVFWRGCSFEPICSVVVSRVILLATLLFVPLTYKSPAGKPPSGRSGLVANGLSAVRIVGAVRGGEAPLDSRHRCPALGRVHRGMGLLLIPQTVEEAAQLSGSWWRVMPFPSLYPCR